jgi:stage III sporulation protein AH
MKVWKRNAVIVTVLVFVCVAVYLNWSAGRGESGADEAMDAQMEEAVSGEDGLVSTDAGADVTVNTEYFAEARLSRQESRDAALSLLTQRSAVDGENASVAEQIQQLADWTLAESQIETLVMAKGFADCVAAISDSGINVMVPSSEEGLASDQVAQITDIVISETGCTANDIVVIPVK